MEVIPIGSNLNLEMLARVIGWSVIEYLKQDGTLHQIKAETEADAVRALNQIQCVLNDQSLKDPECFQHIERIVEALHAYGLSTSRHDF